MSIFMPAKKAEQKPEISGAASTDLSVENSGPTNDELVREEIEELGEDKTEEIVEDLTEELKEEGESETFQKHTEQKPLSHSEEIKQVEQLQPEEFPVFINGRLLLIMTDNIIPNVIVKGAKLTGFKYKKEVADLQLTETEIAELEPLADNVVKDIFANLSPLQQFFIAMGSIYAGKL